jgi:hypothetical protein
MGYIQIEDQVLDCLDEISSNDANEKITILRSKKVYSDDGKDNKPNKKEKYSFWFLKTVINLLCMRITIEKNKSLLMYYCKMLRDLAEWLIYISENWVSQKSDLIREIQIMLSRSIGYIVYFLHQEIRCTEGNIKEYLHDVLNSLMATIFVIVLKKYPRDHEHAPIDTAEAKVIIMVLNGLFEKPDQTLLFIRSDIESYQTRDYKGISTFLTSEQWHDFFEESSRFKGIKEEFWHKNYSDIIAKERYAYAKKIKDYQNTWDYQEKKKYQELSSDITDKHNKTMGIEDYNTKDTLIWIDHKQREMKGFLTKIYNNLFMWRGVWRNKRLFDKEPNNVPVKIFNFVTKHLSKPILK